MRMLLSLLKLVFSVLKSTTAGVADIRTLAKPFKVSMDSHNSGKTNLRINYFGQLDSLVHNVSI
jgi:hypothetical protein